MQLPNVVGGLLSLLGRSCTPTTSGFNNQTAIEFSLKDCSAQTQNVNLLTSNVANATNLCDFYLSG